MEGGAEVNSTRTETCQHPILNDRFKLLDTMYLKKETIKCLQLAEKTYEELKELLAEFARRWPSIIQLEKRLKDAGYNPKLGEKVENQVSFVKSAIKRALKINCHEEAFDTGATLYKRYLENPLAKPVIHEWYDEHGKNDESMEKYFHPIMRAKNLKDKALSKKLVTLTKQFQWAGESYQAARMTYVTFHRRYRTPSSTVEKNVLAAVEYEWACFEDIIHTSLGFFLNDIPKTNE